MWYPNLLFLLTNGEVKSFVSILQGFFFNCKYHFSDLWEISDEVMQSFYLKEMLVHHGDVPRPERPMKRRSLNLAMWFFMTAVALRSSALQFSSFPARTETIVPSSIPPRHTTRNAVGSVLLERQCVGSDEHKTHGLPVRTSSAPIPGIVIGDPPTPPVAVLLHAVEPEDAGRLGPVSDAAILLQRS